MKTYNQFFLFIFCIVTVLFSITSGCMPVDSEESIAQLTFINDDKISFDKEGGIQTFELESNLNWTLIKEDNATWFEINPNKGTSGKTLLTIETSANNGASRKGTFNITSTSLEKRITIFQKGDGSIEEDDGEFITINEIKSLYDRKEQEVYRFSEPLYLEAIVISDREATNRSSQRDGFIQDKTGAGIAFRVSQSIHTFDLGDKLLIDLKGASLLYFGGYLQLNFSEKLASVLSTNHIVVPNEIDIDELMGADFDGTLIKLKDVQFDSTKPTPFHIKGNFTNHTLEDCNGNNLQVKTFKNATFKDELLPLGKGNMVGIAALIDDDYHIHLRNIEDIEEMNDDLETRCSYTIPDDPTSPYITVEKEEFYCSEKRSTHIIDVLSNSEWMATCSATWVAITQPNGYNDGSIQFTVDANNGNKREATITITDGSIIQSVTVIQHGAEEKPATVATDLFFSEYLEGTSYNKYLEIFNGTGADVDLSDYKVELYVNGQTQAKSIEYLDGILKNNDVIVIGHSSAYIYDEEVITSSVTNFNGNDAIALVKISTAEYVDIFGRIGEDPGKAWETSNLDENFGTMDRTLVRKSSVRSGITKNPTRGFPTLGTEWIPYPLNSVDNLGYHIMD